MPSLREQVMSALEALVASQPGVAAVTRGIPATEGGISIAGRLPQVFLGDGEESHSPSASGRLTHILNVEVLILDDPGETSNAQHLDDLRTELHRAILQADRLGLAHVFDVDVVSSSTERESVGDSLAQASLTVEYTYFSDATDPGAYTGVS